MNPNKVTVIANYTSEGISVIYIDIYHEIKRIHIQATKRFVDEINSIPLLDKEKIKTVIAKKYGIPTGNITFA